jgi:hypothetical protein
VLPLPCFSIGIAPVAFGFLGGLILGVAIATILLSLVARCLVGFGCSIGCHLIKGCTLSLFELYPSALRLPFIPGRGYGHTLFLPCETVGFCGFPCDAVGVKEGSFCIGSGATAVGEIVVFLVSHICLPSAVSWL